MTTSPYAKSRFRNRIFYPETRNLSASITLTRNPAVTSNSRKHTISLVIILISAIAGMMTQAHSPRRQSEYSDAAKADYVFLEALKHKSVDSLDSYYDLMRRAYELNPYDASIGEEYGLLRVVVGYPEDSVGVDEGFRLMKRYLESNPSDAYTGLTYVRMATQANRNAEALDALRLLYENAEDLSVVGAAYANALSYTSKPDSLRKAIGILDRLEGYEGKSVDMAVEKMRCYLSLGDTAAVLEEGQQLLASSPRSIEYLTFLGNVNMELDRPDSAIVYFNRAVETDPTSGLAYFRRAQYYNAVGDSVAYDREVFQALQHPDLDIEPKLTILREYVSQLYSDENQRERILAMFRSLVDQYPHEEDVREMFASYLYIIDDLDGAAEQFDYMLALNPEEVANWLSLAQIYYSMGKYSQSEATANSGMKYFPSDVNLYMIASSASIQEDAFDRAEEYLDKAMSVVDSADYSLVASLYGARGDLAFKAKEPIDSVMSLYETALSYDKENSMLLNNIAYYLACNGVDLEKACDYVERALGIEEANNGEQSATTLDTYAWVMFKLKDYAKAKEIIDQVLELDETGDSGDVLEHAGDIYFMNGNPTEALEFWKEALELDPDNELLRRKVKHKTFFYE